MKVAFQGAKGAYSEVALREYFPKYFIPVGMELSEQVCEALLNDQVAMGILPVENSIVGNVNVNMDLLYKHHFFAIGEHYLTINHCLLAHPSAKLEQIKIAHSHPIALAQCRDFLNQHNIIGHPDYDTAGSCKGLKKRNILEQAAIASHLCADYYGLKILKKNIQQIKSNITRFLIFIREDRIPEEIRQEKTSLAFTLHHHPGALLDALQIFKNFDINLTKLESRPIPEDPFSYIFFVDFQGSICDEYIKIALKKLKEKTSHLKVIGSYPLGKLPIQNLKAENRE